MPINLSIHSNIRDYTVSFEDHAGFIDELAQHPLAYFVIDENVWEIYSGTLLKNLPAEATIVLPINEERKSLDTVQELYDGIVERPAKRNLTLISFGGGILQDITGFAASTIYRGINWIYVPTTLLAQADSCIGSKTSLNYRKYKNLIGTFFPPIQIHIHTPFLQSQLDSDFYSGYGEVIKLHLMGGVDLFKQLTELSPHILARENKALTMAIQRSLKVKLTYMDGDEFDMGRRNLLNFGHDFGHALESTSNFDVPHGQAVIFGMIAANSVSRQRGLIDKGLEKEITENLLIPSLVVKPTPEALDADTMINAMKKDKKRTGDKLALIMMNSRFEFTRVNDLTPEEVAVTLDVLKEQVI